MSRTVGFAILRAVGHGCAVPHARGGSARRSRALHECQTKAQAASPVPQGKRNVRLLLGPLLPLRSALGLDGLVLRLLVRSEDREDLLVLGVTKLLHLRLLRLDRRLERIELGLIVRLLGGASFLHRLPERLE